jgi:3-phosphoshikimate 1-carboxyvinyltransferase
MARVAEPLRAMGAAVYGRAGGGDSAGAWPPLTIVGGSLHGAEHHLPVASAQVKSCLLLAGLYAEGVTRVVEPGPSRDHTERMLRARGVAVRSEGLAHSLAGPAEDLAALDTTVPGDFSSAAFFLVAGLLAPAGEICIRNVGVNATRTGLWDVLLSMGARLEQRERRDEGGEPVADLWVRPGALRGVAVGGDVVPRMIDEFSILALAATQAEGVAVVRDAAELRVKETDRIATLVQELRALGARIEARPDGFVIEGPTPLLGTSVDGHGDHRLAMTLAVAGLIAGGVTEVRGVEAIGDSCPGFDARLDRICEGGWR